MKAKRTLYRAAISGKLFWKVAPDGCAVEVNLESAYGLTCVTHISSTAIWKVPQGPNKPIRKAVFEAAYKKALSQIKSV